MLIENILTHVANFVGMPEMINTNLISGDYAPTKDEEEAYNLMLNCINLVNETIASEYYSLTDEIELESNGEVLFSAIKARLNNIIKIEKNGQSVPFSCTSTTIKTVKGKIKITYSCLPQIITKSSFQIQDYPIKITERIFAYGVSGEYYFIKGLYDDANVWDNRFKNALLNVLRPKHNVTIKKREWV